MTTIEMQGNGKDILRRKVNLIATIVVVKGIIPVTAPVVTLSLEVENRREEEVHPVEVDQHEAEVVDSDIFMRLRKKRMMLKMILISVHYL